MQLSERVLLAIGGAKAYQRARGLHASGAVSAAAYDPPLLKGQVRDGGKTFAAGLKILSAADAENLCSCRESRLDGLICAHALAVGLEVVKPTAGTRNREELPAPAVPSSTGDFSTEIPSVQLAIEGSLRQLQAQLRFDYSARGGTNPAAEEKIRAQLRRAGFEVEGAVAVLRGEEKILRFASSVLPELRRRWEVEEGERWCHVSKDFVRIEPRFAVKEGMDGWLDLRLQYAVGQQALLTPEDLRLLLQSGRNHIRLQDGRTALADASLALEIEEVLRDCNPVQEAGHFRVAPVHRGYLEASLLEWQGAEGRAKSNTPPLALGSLQKRLRPYQIEGAQWLLRHALAGAGGLLADEMGLGKTVQTLALLEKLQGPSLVVCPSSLVWNWKREAASFLPDLRVLTLDGPDRSSRFDQVGSHDLVVTSYALLRRDLDFYRRCEFTSVVLDEAQHIKNPESQNAKAACALKARSRFILTGTPVENSVRDLWSLFSFLLPGYLGSKEDFRDRYELPLASGDNASVWPRLNRRLAPYLLRRRKSEILRELPDKIEQTLEVELTPGQQAAYTQLQDAARAAISDLEGQKAAGAARMKALTALLRLRQACCDLRLLGVEKSENEASAKLTALLELVSETVDGGHRALIFSQFTSMLDLIQTALEREGFAFCRLDGTTRDRQAVVERFQNDATIPVFLISLKAGGVGLNLTAADTVIHFDPWWNPAAEAQATDRAHRIGQKSVVTSIRLIARNTVEERVMKMQIHKRGLLAGAIDFEQSAPSLDAEALRELVQ